MKKALRFFIFSIITAAALFHSAFGATEQMDVSIYSMSTGLYTVNSVATAQISYNGSYMSPDVPAFIMDGRTLVPIRFISELLGAEVGWDEETSQASITTDDKSIILTIGSPYAVVNGEIVILPNGIPAALAQVGGVTRTVVPLRFVSEQLGAAVNWDNDSYTAVINTESIEAQSDAVISSIYSNDVDQQIVIVGEKDVDYNIFTLDQRVVIDILGTVLADSTHGTMTLDNDAITAVRYSQYDQGYEGYDHIVRVVLDLKEDASYPEDVSVDSLGALIIVNTSSDYISNAEAEDTAGKTDKSTGDQAEYEEPVNPNQVLIVLDPGHGGSDPGASYFGEYEKNITLPIAKRVKALLEEEGLQVRMTRSTDTYVGLYDRSDYANDLNATVFVSIHANAAPLNPTASGIETYYYSENEAGGKLAAKIHTAILDSTGAVDRKVRTARFVVIKETEMPSVLIETGFMTNEEEFDNLTDAKYQEKLAQGICNGILDYLGL